LLAGAESYRDLQGPGEEVLQALSRDRKMILEIPQPLLAKTVL
tara:strand:+ start:267 stop:395 length:129 start_codon:yes stop_codon:yes gene_type:complete